MSCYKDTLQTCGRQRLNVTEYKSTHYIPPFESAWGMWVKDRAKEIKKRYEKKHKLVPSGRAGRAKQLIVNKRVEE